MDRRSRDNLIFHLLRGFLAAGSRAPLALGRPVGRALSRGALLMLGRERRRMEFNIAVAFPELEPRERRRLMRGCADHFGRVLAEVAWLWRAEAADVERMVEIEGIEHLRKALEEGRGGILATGHLGNWELLNARLAVAGIPITIAVRELDDSRVDGLITALRTRFGSEVILRGSSAGRELIRALGKGRGVGLLIDQDIPSIPGVFVPFFGRQAWTPSGAAMLALRARCSIMPGFIHRKPDGTHKIKIDPPLKTPDEGSLKDRVRVLTAAATAAVEWQVRAWPEQWVWMHRRWRTRPESEAKANGAGMPADDGS
jgi:KDO2-lipid IV(A) lauroyltransferase